MKERLRNKIIMISCSQYLEIKMICVIFGLLLVSSLTCVGPKWLYPIAAVSFVSMFIAAWVWECFDAIKRFPKERLTRNKIINVVFSAREPWEILILLISVVLTIIVVILFDKRSSLIFAIAWFAAIILGNKILVRILPKIFKSRLIE